MTARASEPAAHPRRGAALAVRGALEDLQRRPRDPLRPAVSIFALFGSGAERRRRRGPRKPGTGGRHEDDDDEGRRSIAAARRFGGPPQSCHLRGAPRGGDRHRRRRPRRSGRRRAMLCGMTRRARAASRPGTGCAELRAGRAPDPARDDAPSAARVLAVLAGPDDAAGGQLRPERPSRWRSGVGRARRTARPAPKELLSRVAVAAAFDPLADILVVDALPALRRLRVSPPLLRTTRGATRRAAPRPS